MLGRLVSNSWARGVLGTLLVRGLHIVIGLLGSVVVARVLGPAGRGEIYVAAMLVMMGTTVLNLGLHTANSFEVSRDSALLRPVVGNAVWLTLITGGATACIVGAVVVLDIGMPLSGSLLVLALAALPLQLLFTQLHPLLIVTERLRSFNVLETLQRAGLLIGVGVAWLYGSVTPSAIFGGSVAVAGLCSVLIVRRLWTSAPGSEPNRSWALLRRQLPYARRVYLGTMASLLLLRVDVVMIEAQRGSVAVGLYSIAASVGDLVLLAPSTISVFLFPRLAAQGDAVERWRVTKRVTLVVGVFLTLVATGLAVFAEVLVRTLYGTEFIGSVDSVLLLLPGVVLLGVNSVLMHYLAAVGMPRIAVIGPATALALNVLLNLDFIPRWGIEGAAVASSLSYGLMAAVTAAWIGRNRPGSLIDQRATAS